MSLPLGKDPDFDALLDKLADEPKVVPELFTPEWWASRYGAKYWPPNSVPSGSLWPSPGTLKWGNSTKSNRFRGAITITNQNISGGEDRV